ncbi:hypothetical protein NW762_013705 [Fusarium torreyae]|uniref:DUF7908 domain-containing protein n=1 Tax=Fusarium torreyae TaxID=1237075 RepID=A0A9W8V7C3_9HYPO|nr:hypothetical protein NW762_013705 [Fusarium torreyae]
MIAKTLVIAALAATVAAGPCKPKDLPSDIFSVSSDSTLESTTSTESGAGSTIESTVLDFVTTTSSEQSITTTEIASTTTASEPAGEPFILQVVPQRRLTKRDTTFVGNNNPTSCTFATVFRIDSEQLLQDGVPVYYEDQGYQEFTAQENQCQNGHIVGLEESITEATSAAESTSVGVTTSADENTSNETTSGKETSSVEDTTSAEVTSYFVDETSSTEATKTSEEITSTETTSHFAEATSSVDACVEGILNLNGQPDLQSRIHDCSVYNTVTVSPLTSTATIVKRRVLYQVPTAWATPQPMIRRRADDPTDTTIFPTSVPPYATYCDSPSDYYEACSEAGITAVTTTLPKPDTTTTTSTSDVCAPKSKFKRAVEYLGYTMSEDWDRAIFTGIALHERFHD